MEQYLSTSIILEKRTPKKNGTFPLKLRVTHLRKQKYYAIGVSLNEEDFLKLSGSKPRGMLKELKFELSNIEDRANAIIRDMDHFSFAHFERQFLKKNTSRRNSLTALFEDYIDKLATANKLKSAITYKCALKSLSSFSGDPLLLTHIDESFLAKYEHWMLERGNSKTTVGFYLRSLRAILNRAIANGMYDKEKYPFGNNKYRIPMGVNIKKALTKEDLKRIKNYKVDSQNISEGRYRDYWLFSFYCNGINVKDLARLQFKNIRDEAISIIRSKTENSGRKQRPIIITLLPQARKIIDKWGNLDRPENYVFPILRAGITSDEELKIVAQTVQNINKTMKRIASGLKINVPVTTYVARHSFATILKRGGAPIEYISESLGHSNVLTTENYLGSFDDETRTKFSKILTDL